MEKERDKFTRLDVELMEFDFLRHHTFEHALDGVQKVFLMRPPQLGKPKHDMQPFMDEMKKRKLEHIVFVSLMGVEKNPIVPHRKIEDMIRESGIGYTFLRPGFFMQNLNTTHRDGANQSMKKKLLSSFLFVVGAIPLLFTPIVLMANIMSLAGERTGNEGFFTLFVVYSFIAVSSTYFLTYLGCLIYRFTRKGKEKPVLLSVIPLFHLALAVVLFSLWSSGS